MIKRTLFTAFLSICITTVHAATVTNPGFETGSLSGWTLGGTALASYGDASGPDTGNDNIYDLNQYVGVASALAPGVYPPHSGNDYAYFGAGGPNIYYTISQTIATTSGQPYEVSFWVANDTTPDVIQGYLNYVSASFGSGTFTLENIPGTTDASGYVLYSFSGNATSDSTLLSLTFDNYAGYFDLDDISVTASVPEPASLPLIAPAAALLLISRRKRRLSASFFSAFELVSKRSLWFGALDPPTL